jgi:hypothetical protein
MWWRKGHTLVTTEAAWTCGAGNAWRFWTCRRRAVGSHRRRPYTVSKGANRIAVATWGESRDEGTLASYLYAVVILVEMRRVGQDGLTVIRAESQQSAAW